jgi:hypothetical protein
LAPKSIIEPPMAKKDSHGNLITGKSKLEKLYLETYVNRCNYLMIRKFRGNERIFISVVYGTVKR